MDFKETTQLLDKAGFVIQSQMPPDLEHFGNWVLIAARNPIVLRVTNDRGVFLDLMERDDFEAGANESDWFNWDVVARALQIQEMQVEEQLWFFVRNFLAVENAFLRPNWATTKDLLRKVELEKRREFMGGVAPALA